MGTEFVKAEAATTEKKKTRSPLETAKKWTFGRTASLITRLGPVNARHIVKGKLRVRFENRAFSTPKEQVEIWRKVMPESLRDIVTFPSDIPQLPEGFCSALVLTLVGPSAAAELKLYWEILAKVRGIKWAWEEFFIDQEPAPRWWNNYRRDFWSLEWQRIDFVPSQSKVPINDLRTQKGPAYELPSAGPLAALIVHPEWREIYRKGYDPDWFGVRMAIPGYVVMSPRKLPWFVNGGSISMTTFSDKIEIDIYRNDISEGSHVIQFVPYDL